MTAEDEEWITRKLASEHLAYQDDGEPLPDEAEEPTGDLDRAALKRKAAAVAQQHGKVPAKPLLVAPPFGRRVGTAGRGTRGLTSVHANVSRRELTLPEIGKLKTYEVKAELRQRELDDRGTRQQLLDRLEVAVMEELRHKAIGSTLSTNVSTASLVSLPSEPNQETTVGGAAGGGSSSSSAATGGKDTRRRSAPAQRMAGATSSDPVRITGDWLQVAVADFAFEPRHACIPFGAVVGWKVAATELGMIEYQLTITDTSDSSPEPVAVSSPLVRNQLWKHQFTQVGTFQVTDDNYAELFGTIEVFAVQGWREKKKMILASREEQERRRRAVEASQASEAKARQLIEKQEEERRWRVEADALAAEEQEHGKADPSTGRALANQRAEAVAASVDLVTGGWRSRLNESVLKREEQCAARQKEMERQQAEREKEAARQAALRAAEEAEAERQRLELEVKQAAEAAERDEQRLWRQEMQRLGDEEAPEKEPEEPVTPADATPRQPTRPNTERPAHSRPGRPHSDRPAESVAVEPQDATVAAVDESDGGGGAAGSCVVIEEGAATPAELSVAVGATVVFAVGEDEPGMIEYGVVVRRAAEVEAGEDAAPLATSEPLTAGETWEWTVEEAGSFVCADPDEPEVVCVVHATPAR